MPTPHSQEEFTSKLQYVNDDNNWRVYAENYSLKILKFIFSGTPCIYINMCLPFSISTFLYALSW